MKQLLNLSLIVYFQSLSDSKDLKAGVIFRSKLVKSTFFSKPLYRKDIILDSVNSIKMVKKEKSQ